MRNLYRLVPLSLVAMALTGCAVVAEGPPGQSMGQDRPRQDRRDDHKDARRSDDRRSDDRRGDRERRDDRGEDRRGGSVPVQIGGYFGERQRADVYAHYGQPPRAHCPPGLATKGNGCQPPGLAKKWKLGQPLPHDISYRPVEADIRVRIGTPPAGYEFVRLAQDILMIAVGTAIVIDAIEDLQR